MRNYEVTFIVDPVLSAKEIKATAQTYVDRLQKEGCKIVDVSEMGLQQLAYPINSRTSGIYYCVEFETPTGDLIAPVELSMRRDERLMRFLTVKLDKFGVKYNEDKRAGKIGKAKKPVKKGKDEKHPPHQREHKKHQRPKQAPPKPKVVPTPAPPPPVAKAEEEE